MSESDPARSTGSAKEPEEEEEDAEKKGREGRREEAEVEGRVAESVKGSLFVRNCVLPGRPSLPTSTAGGWLAFSSETLIADVEDPFVEAGEGARWGRERERPDGCNNSSSSESEERLPPA